MPSRQHRCLSKVRDRLGQNLGRPPLRTSGPLFRPPPYRPSLELPQSCPHRRIPKAWGLRRRGVHARARPQFEVPLSRRIVGLEPRLRRAAARHPKRQIWDTPDMHHHHHEALGQGPVAADTTQSGLGCLNAATQATPVAGLGLSTGIRTQVCGAGGGRPQLGLQVGAEGSGDLTGPPGSGLRSRTRAVRNLALLGPKWPGTGQFRL